MAQIRGKDYTKASVKVSKEGHSFPIGGKVPPSIPSSIPIDTYVLAKLLQNGTKFIQKLTPGFKNHMRNFRQAVKSPKS